MKKKKYIKRLEKRLLRRVTEVGDLKGLLQLKDKAIDHLKAENEGLEKRRSDTKDSLERSKGLCRGLQIKYEALSNHMITHDYIKQSIGDGEVSHTEHYSKKKKVGDSYLKSFDTELQVSNTEQWYECLMEVVMDGDGEVVFMKGKTYRHTEEYGSDFIDESGELHGASDDWMKEHFKKVIPSPKNNLHTYTGSTRDNFTNGDEYELIHKIKDHGDLGYMFFIDDKGHEFGVLHNQDEFVPVT